MGIDGSEDTDWSKILWAMAKTGLVPLKKNQNILTHLYSQNQEENLEQETSFNLGGVAEPRRPGLTRSNSTRRRKPNRNRPTSDGEPDTNKKKQTGTLPWFLNLVGPPGNRLNNRCKLIMTNWITNSIQDLQAKTGEMGQPGQWDPPDYRDNKAFKEFMEVLDLKVFKGPQERKDHKVHLVFQVFQVTFPSFYKQLKYNQI